MVRLRSFPRSRRPGLLTLIVVFSFAAVPGLAQDVPSADGPLLDGKGKGLPFACRPGSWDLGGADFKVSDTATFKTEWRPTLEDIAACLSHPRMAKTCATVQGMVDEKKFTLAVVRAYGSRRGAQAARARARSSQVIAELMKLGASSRQLEEMPPPREAFYRGARIELKLDCLKNEAPKVAGVSREELAEAVHAAVSKVAAETGVTPVPVSAQHLWVDATLSASLLAGDPEVVFAPVLSLGGGWSNELLYAHLDVGMQLGTSDEQRLGVEFSASIGYVFSSPDWLEIGITGGDRISAPGVDQPWLEQTWFVGIESSQCLFSLWEGNETCIQETLVPLSFRIHRGTVTDGQIERTLEKSSAQFRFDVALVTRHDFL